MPRAWILTCLAAVVAAIALPAVASDESPDQVNDPPMRVFAGCSRSGESFSQGFTPSRRLLAAVALRLRVGGSFPSGGLSFALRIRRDWPGGEVVGSAVTAVPPLGTGTTALVRGQFTQALILEPAGTYVIDGPSLADNVLAWVGSDTDVYPGGAAFSCGGYLAQGLDFNFITYTPPDAADPETKIIAGAPASPSRSRDARIAFSGSDDLSYAANLRFACSSDGRPAAECASPLSLVGLHDGHHSFQVAARDEAGHSDPSAAQVDWIVDTTPPHKPTVTGPRQTRLARPTYVLAAVDAIDPPDALRYRCSLGTPRLQACARLIRPLLTIGDHLLRVAAVDRAGNTSRVNSVRLTRIR